jgi:hypothetical protein
VQVQESLSLFEGELVMGANSTQGVALLLFLVGFTFPSGAMFTGGSGLPCGCGHGDGCGGEVSERTPFAHGHS